jgi:long-chain acyl-CoA synthetase
VGAAVVPMNVLLKEREVGYHLVDSSAALLLAWHEFADAAHLGAEHAGAECVLVEPGDFETLLGRCDPVDDTVERAAADTAVILYTSGTTGTPKGAELTHQNLLRNVEVVIDLFGIDERAVMLGALPLFHSFGQTCALNATVAVGGVLTLLPRFEPGKALEIIERDRVTVFEGVPTMYAAMLNDRRATEGDVSALELCVSGGAATAAGNRDCHQTKIVFFCCSMLEQSPSMSSAGDQLVRLDLDRVVVARRAPSRPP